MQNEIQQKEQEIAKLTVENAKAKEGQDRSGQEIQSFETSLNEMREDIDRLRREKS